MTQSNTDSNLKLFALNSNRPLAKKSLNTWESSWENFQWTVLVTVKFKLTLRKASVVTTSTLFSQRQRPLMIT